MSRPTPIEVAQRAVQAAWDAPAAGEADTFPSTYGTADAVLGALYKHGYRIVDARQHDALMVDHKRQTELRRAAEVERDRIERQLYRTDT
jgi:hypothetical protein